jgi:hypothetical protein
MRTITYDVVIVDIVPVKIKFPPLPLAALFGIFFGGASAARCKLSRRCKKSMRPKGKGVEVGQERYAVVFSRNNRKFNDSAVFSSHATASEFLEAQARINPKLKGRLHIVPEYEVAA